MVIVLGKETRLTIVSALHDVQRDVGKVNAAAARHAATLSENHAPASEPLG